MYMRVARTRIWYVVPGRLADGSTIDALRRTPLQWTRPANFQSAQGGFRWTHYINNAVDRARFEPEWAGIHPALLKYLCRDWNRRHSGEKRLEQVELSVVLEEIPEPGNPEKSPQIIGNLAAQDCRAAD